MTTRTSRPISGSAVAGPAKADIHSCGYFCDRPACIKAQRDMLPALHHTLAQTQLDLTAQTAECFALRAELKELDALKADIANALTDLTDCSIENDALRARVAELGSVDTCGRVCEGTAYRLEARSLRAKVDELQADNTSLLALVADIRCALGDNGKRMQTELIEWCAELVKARRS